MDPREYYSRGYVAEEIAGFLGGRWAAVATSGGRWARWEGDKPLTIDSPREVALHAGRGARSFYGTIEVFARLETSDDVTRLYDLNVVAADSFIDIDILDESRVGEAWRSAIRAAAAIVEWLREWGVEESVYLVWSGAGVHVRVNRMALEAPGLDLHPLARSLVLAEYALRSNRERLEAIVEASGGLIKVENIVARNRVFTAPLSLHRRLPMAAVPFPPGELEGFTPEWARPESPRYWPRLWERQKKGEAARLVAEGRFHPGDRPTANPSGGLKSRGHPVGATGVYQVVEVAMQLRGDFPGVKVPDAEHGLALNMGGDGSTVAVHVLTRI